MYHLTSINDRATPSKLILVTSVTVFLFSAISLVVPSGYSVGAIILLFAGLGLLVTFRAPRLSKEDILIIGALCLYAFVSIVEAWWDAQGSRGLDKPIRYLLAVPALLWILRFPPRLAFLWSGFAVGAIAAGSWAAWQRVFENIDRAGGHTHVIQFGNLSMLLGVLCLAGLGWASIQRHRNLWFGLLMLGALSGILGSLLSGSRGGWVGFPIVLWVLYRGYGTSCATWLKALIVSVVLLGGFAAYAVPQIGVQERVHEAVSDIRYYITYQESGTSVGARFEMWRGAALLIREKPVFGWGENGYRQGLVALGEQNIINENVTHYGHAHNEFIDAFAKRGIVGLSVLLILYFVPMRLFFRKFKEPDMAKRSVAVAGALLPVAYIDFGLTQAFLTHNSGVMMYAFLLAILWGIHSSFYRHNHPST